MGASVPALKLRPLAVQAGVFPALDKRALRPLSDGVVVTLPLWMASSVVERIRKPSTLEFCRQLNALGHSSFCEYL